MSIAWTLGAIVSRATTALGNRLDVTLSDGSFWANAAQQEVWDDQPHREKEALAFSSTTTGVSRINLPTDFNELINLSLSSAERDVLELINRDEFDSDAGSFSSFSGRPTKFIQYSGCLELYPVPDSAYSIQLRYNRQLSTMTALTAAISVGTRYGQAVMYKTAALLGQNVLRDFESATLFEDRYVRFILKTADDRALRIREQHYMGVSLPRKQR